MNRDKLTIAISGTHGLIGKCLIERFRKIGFDVKRIVRFPEKSADSIYIDTKSDRYEKSTFSGVDVVIHLAGASIGDGRWTAKRKQEIIDSRVISTTGIAESISYSESKPSLFICASAIGFYGNTGDCIVTESTPAGTGFLADVCQAWENAAARAASVDTRVVHARLGVVLSPDGGVLQRMIPLFKFGIGGQLGNGNQYLSWISIEDVARTFEHCIRHDNLCGAVNFVSPEPVTNRDFTRALAEFVRRPALLTVPEFALKLLMGEMAQSLLLDSCRAIPEKLQQTGFEFLNPSLKSVLHRINRH